VLDLDGNRIMRLPAGFGSLTLRSLKAAYNRLEGLGDDQLMPSLAPSLQRLWLSR
jgi:hypothetical protein